MSLHVYKLVVSFKAARKIGISTFLPHALDRSSNLKKKKNTAFLFILASDFQITLSRDDQGVIFYVRHNVTENLKMISPNPPAHQ